MSYSPAVLVHDNVRFIIISRHSKDLVGDTTSVDGGSEATGLMDEGLGGERRRKQSSDDRCHDSRHFGFSICSLFFFEQSRALGEDESPSGATSDLSTFTLMSG